MSANRTHFGGLTGLAIGMSIAAMGLAIQECRLHIARRRLHDAYIQLAAARREALHDPLTGLPNRRAFLQRLGDLLTARQRFAVEVVDLDGFKAVNDTVDHVFGDEQLTAVAASLATVPADLVARLGGDEFALLVRGGAAMAHLAARAVCHKVARTIIVPGDHHAVLRLSATVGIALPRPGDTPGDVLRRADIANRHAKRHRLHIHQHP